MRPGRLCWIYLLVLVTIATGGPVRSRRTKLSSCSRHCRVPGKRKFHYSPDNVYEFTYTTQTASHPQQQPDESAKIVIHATAHVHVLSTCDMVLKMREVRIFESDPASHNALRKADNSRHFRSELERESLRFAFQDGEIPDICPSEGETTWALNIKRGFLSAFQTSMDTLDVAQTVMERDVAGQCRTDYMQVASGWFSRSLRKSRNLTQCSRPVVHSSSLPGLDHLLPSLLQSSSPLTGRQECTQTVDWNGLLTSATCTEQHHFLPVSGETTDGGLVTIVTQNIQFLQQRTRGRFSPPASRRMSMEYEHTGSRDNSKNVAIRIIKTQLRQLCDVTDVTPETPDMFYDLVTHVRKMDTSGLRLLYERVSGTSVCANNKRGKKIFLDAMAAAGTDSSVRVLTRLLVSGDVKGSDVTFLLIPLTFLPRPSPAMLQTVKNLLESKHTWREAILPVSGLVHNYCRRHQDCDSNPDVHRIILIMKRIVGSQCLANHQNTDRMLLGIRALGNSGQAGRVKEMLDNCVRRRNNPMDVRLAAARALRTLPCHQHSQRVWRVFEDRREDGGLRIAAYRTVMHCVTPEVLRHVQRTLAVEKDKQVEGYVYSHLKELQMQGGRYSQEMDKVLEMLSVGRNMSGFSGLQSRNMAGVLWERLNVSIHTDAHVVWPSASPALTSSTWLPRSADVSVDMTVGDGRLNLLEVGGREEGLGFFLRDVVLPYFGRRRDSVGPKKRLYRLSQLKGSVYTKILGNEISFHRLAASRKWAEQLTSGKRQSVKDLLSGMSEDGRLELGQNMVLLDTRVVAPTAAGLPLSVSINSTMCWQLHVTGRLDLRQLFIKPRGLHVQGDIRPSGAVRMTGSMNVDGVVTRAGVRMTGTVHSNTLLRGHVQLERGRIMSAQLDFPTDTMDIVSIRSDFSLIHHKMAQQLSPPDGRRRMLSACTGQTAARVTGLELCGHADLPLDVADRKSVSGWLHVPASAAVILYRRDSHSSYKLLAKHVKTRHSTDTQLSFTTPGSKVDRTLAVDFQLDVKQRKLQIGFATPWKSAELSGSLTNNARLRGLRCTLLIDKVTYGVVAEVKVTRSKGDVIYTPVFELYRPGSRVVTLTGAAKLGRHWKASVLDLSLSGVTDDPLKVKVTVTNKRQEVSVRMTSSRGVTNTYSLAAGTFISVTGQRSPKVEVTPFFFLNTPSRQLISLTGRGDYREGKVFRTDVKLSLDGLRPMSLQFAIVKTPTRKLDRYKMNFALRTSVAMVTFDSNADVRPGRMLNSRVTLTHNIPDVMPDDTVVIVTKLNDRSTSVYWNYLLAMKLDSRLYPDHSFDLKVNTEHRARSSRSKLLLKYGHHTLHHINHVLVNSKMKHDVTNLYNVVLATKTDVQVPAKNVDIQLQGSHKHSPKILQSRMTLSQGEGHQIRARVMLADRSRRFLTLVGRGVLDIVGDELTNTTDTRTRPRRKAPKRDPSIIVNFRMEEDDDQYDVKSGAFLGRKKRDFSTSINLKKPVSVQRVQMFLKAHGIKTYNELEAEVSHEMHPLLAGLVESVFVEKQHDLDYDKAVQLLSTVNGAGLLQTAREDFRDAESVDNYTDIVDILHRNFTQLVAVNTDQGDMNHMNHMNHANHMNHKMNVKGGVRLKSSFVDVFSSSVNFAHKFDADKYSSGVNMDQNGDQYGCSVTLTDPAQSWRQKSLGKVALTLPEQSVSAEWNHEMTSSRIRSTLLSSWAGDRRVYLDFNGKHESTNETQETTSDVILQSPWRPVRDWRVSYGQEVAWDSLRSKSLVRASGVKQVSHQVTVVHTASYTDAGLLLYTPWTRKVSSTIRTRHDLYPVTATIELSWPIRQKLSTTGSVTLNSWDDFDLFLNLKTTVHRLRPTVVELSNKMYGENLVSEISFNYGRSNTFSVESSLRRSDFKRWRLRVLTPVASCRVLETGFEVDGNLTDLATKADFRIFPRVGRYEGEVTWQIMQDTFTGRLSVDTPLKHFPYLHVTAVSDRIPGGRVTNVTASHHPDNHYTLNATYILHPYFLLEVDLDTPLPDLHKIQTAIHHVHNASHLTVHASITCPPQRTVSGMMTVEVGEGDTERHAGTVVVVTSFPAVGRVEAEFDVSQDMMSVTGNASLTHHSHVSWTSVVMERTLDQLSAGLQLQTPLMRDVLFTCSSSSPTSGPVSWDMHVRYGDNVSVSVASKSRDKYFTDGQSLLSYTLSGEETRIIVSHLIAGQPDNFTLAGHMDVNDVAIFNASVSHVFDTDLLNSSFNLRTYYTDDLNIHIIYTNTTDNVTSQVAVLLHPLYEFSCNSRLTFQPMSAVDTTLRVKSPFTGDIHQALHVAVNRSAPRHNFSAGVQFSRSRNGSSEDLDTMETAISHEGQVDDFRTYLLIKPLHTKAIETTVEWVYTSPFVWKSSATFRSPFRLGEDLSVQVDNTDQGGSQRSMVSLGWASYRRIMLDATFRNQSAAATVDYQADVVLVTPFRHFQTCAVRVGHNQFLTRREDKMEVEVNGRRMLELQLMAADMSFPGIRHAVVDVADAGPLVVPVTGGVYNTDLFFNWDINDPSRAAHVTSRVKCFHDKDTVERDVVITVRHQQRTAAVDYHVSGNHTSVSGEGGVAFDPGNTDNVPSRFYYLYSHHSTHNASDKRSEAMLKVGCPWRAVEASGSWSDMDRTDVDTPSGQGHGGQTGQGHREQTGQAVMFWDADGDRTKHVSLTSRVTSGAGRSVDVIVALPSIKRQLQIQHDLLRNYGNTIWNLTSCVAFTPDKTLTFSSSLMSHGMADSLNYTLATALTLPYADLDLGCTSDVAADNGSYWGRWRSWYVTTSMKREEVELRASIDQLRREIHVQTTTANGRVNVKVKEVVGDPYHVTLSGKLGDVDSNDTIVRLESHYVTDAANRSLVFNTSQWSDGHRHSLVMAARYINDTDVKAEVYRNHVTGRVTDAMLQFHLNSSTLLHTRLRWRPSLLNEIQILCQDFAFHLAEYDMYARETLSHVTSSVADELDSKYSAVTSLLLQEVTPVVHVVNTELQDLGGQLDLIVMLMEAAYVDNKDTITSTGLDGSVESVLHGARRLSTSYTTLHTQLAQELRVLHDVIKTFPVSQHYRRLVTSLADAVRKASRVGAATLEETVAVIDRALLAARGRFSKLQNTISAHGALQERLLTSVEQYPVLQSVTTTASELYQQGFWLLDYWHVTQRVQRRLASISQSLEQLLLTELRHRLRHFRTFRESRVTHWRPQDGEVQAEIALPFPVETL